MQEIDNETAYAVFASQRKDAAKNLIKEVKDLRKEVEEIVEEVAIDLTFRDRLLREVLTGILLNSADGQDKAKSLRQQLLVTTVINPSGEYERKLAKKLVKRINKFFDALDISVFERDTAEKSGRQKK